MLKKVYEAIDIAKWFINYNNKLRNIDNEDTDNISNLKLQKLLYYAQGSVLAIYDSVLFNDEILAWSHGPVVKSVYDEFKSYGSNGINEYYENIKVDHEIEKILVQVYNIFGQYSAWGLRNLTHEESPWKETKRNEVITTERIKKYFKENYVQ